MRLAAFVVFFLVAVGCTTMSGGTDTTSSVTTTAVITEPVPSPVPDVQGMSADDAKVALTEVGLAWDVTTKPVHDNGDVGTVLHQDPGPNSVPVDISQPVPVVLTVGVPFPSVPDVVGKLLDKAKSIIKNTGYKVGKVARMETTTHRNLEVMSQSPKAGTEALTGKTVNLVIWHNNCTPGYSPCLPLAYDYDCYGGTGDGPKYTGLVRVTTGYDPYDLDRDNDGYGCD